MRRLLFGAVAFAIAGVLAAPARADTRVALVVGNARYVGANIHPLANPENDARVMATTLRSLGFSLVGDEAQLNLDEEKFRQRVKEFAKESEGADVALFYYAGHGVKGEDSNYLVPVDADLTKEPDFYALLDANYILSKMNAAGPRIKVVILDACRNNPFVAGRSLAIGRGRDTGAPRLRDIGPAAGGLAQMAAPKGTLIAFATEPGKTAQDGPDGGNSPYTQVLAETMRGSGAGIVDMFSEVSEKVAALTGAAQVPAVSLTSIDSTFRLAAAAGQAAKVATAASAAAAPSAADIARTFEKEQRTAALAPTGAARPQNAAPTAPIALGLLSPEQERALKASDHFKECENCPEMVTVPAGSFVMGSPANEPGREAAEGPQQRVAFARPFAVGRSAVTFAEWNACVAEGGCNAYRPGDYGWGGGQRPVINVSWNDAEAYVKWLSAKTGAPYRLLSEAEREYVTRGCAADCASTPFWFGAQISPERANYDWRYSYAGGPKAQPPRRTVATDASEPNPFGLFQVHGNVREWVADCWNENLAGLPHDGTARMTGDCSAHVLKGGSWADEPKDLRSAKRSWEVADERRAEIGFRVARTLRN